MKLKLIHKFFLAFLFTGVFIIVLFFIAARVFVYQHYTDYVDEVELGKLDHLMEVVKAEYREHGGWGHIRSNPEIWHPMVGRQLLKDHHISDSSSFPVRVPGRPEFNPPIDPLQIGLRLSLFDANKRKIAGWIQRETGYHFREIREQGRCVGWLGLLKTDMFYHPLDMAYLKKQSKAMYLIAGAVLSLALVLAYFFSRYLLGPVELLTKGTKALSKQKFDTKIQVDRKDELGQLSSDFNKMADTLKKYEEMRAQWIVDISHELRTPLAVLRGELEALQDGIREIKPSTLDSLHEEVIRLSRLVDDLHQLSLADSTDLAMEKRPVKPLAILAGTIHLFENRFSEKEISIQKDTRVSDNIRIMGNESRLAQLFTNLMENSLRYTDSPGKLTVKSDIRERFLLICFEDSPPSVPKENLERIFDRLFRVDKSRSRALGGSGLGLSICRQIVERHGGAIRAEPSAAGGLGIHLEFSVISNG